MVRQLLDTSGSSGLLADSVNMLSFRSMFSTSLETRSARAAAFYKTKNIRVLFIIKFGTYYLGGLDSLFLSFDSLFLLLLRFLFCLLLRLLSGFLS